VREKENEGELGRVVDEKKELIYLRHVKQREGRKSE
jgi:hypothetical protein